jgi:hypothetical protein
MREAAHRHYHVDHSEVVMQRLQRWGERLNVVLFGQPGDDPEAWRMTTKSIKHEAKGA